MFFQGIALGDAEGQLRMQGKIASSSYLCGEAPSDQAVFGGYLAEIAERKGVQPKALALSLFQDLALKMHLDGQKRSLEQEAPLLPAGMAFLAQLMLHDMISPVTANLDGDASPMPREWTLPSFDLSCLYRGGSFQTPHLYARPEKGWDYPGARTKFRLGYTSGERYGPARLYGVTAAFTREPQPCDLPLVSCHSQASSFVDLHRGSLSKETTPRHFVPYPSEVIVGDPRNDSHLLISQLTVFFYRLHNKILELLTTELPNHTPRQLFERTRSSVIAAYRCVILHDLLKRVLDPLVYARFLKNPFAGVFAGRLRSEEGCLPLPAEFWLAGSLFFLPMIRPLNRLNGMKDALHGNLRSILTHRVSAIGGSAAATSIPGFPISNDWIVEWQRFFPPSSGEGTFLRPYNPSHRIAPILAAPFYSLKQFEPLDLTAHRPIHTRFGGVAFCALASGYVVGLPSGQALSAILGSPSLSEAHLCGGGKEGLAGRNAQSLPNPLTAEAQQILAKDTPLFYYLLREAELCAEGAHLGPVGSTLFGEVVFPLLERAALKTPLPILDWLATRLASPKARTVFTTTPGERSYRDLTLNFSDLVRFVESTTQLHTETEKVSFCGHGT